MESSVADVTSFAPGSEALIQRCVIVQRDQKGYGLTVSGDNPVRIQSVKLHGAASKAGVQEGDTIIKVNGSLVTSSNHAEVVKLIKAAGSYVALTLLGKQPAASSGPIPPTPNLSSSMDETRNITLPYQPSEDTSRQYFAERVDTLKHMLESEKVMFLELQAKYTDNPTEKLKKELASVRNRIKLLDGQVSNAESISRLPVHDAMNENVPTQVDRRSSDWLPQGAHHQRQVSSPDTVIYSQINPRDIESSNNVSVKRNRSDARDVGKRLKGDRRGAARHIEERKRRSNELEKSKSLPMDSEQDEEEEARNRAATIGGSVEDSREGNVDTMNLFNPTPSNPTSDMFKPAPISEPHNKQIMAMEDEFTSDQEMFDEPGPFDRLEELEKKPAHLAVFLHYLISNSDPSSLFFYLVTESYKEGSHKDMKRWSYEIFSTFIAENAPMKVEGVTKETVESIESEMSASSLTEDRMRHLFTAAQGQAVSEVLELLGEFRIKRSLGLGSIFGDQQLTQENMDRQQEIKIVEQILLPHLERTMSTNLRSEDKNQALASALGTFMRQVGVKVHGNSSLDRVPSFTNRDKKKGTRPSKKHVKGHQFQETHYTSTAFCGACNGLLWGIGNQGMRCQDCELNIHKNDVCMEKLVDQCQGKSRRPRVSGIRVMKNRLPTVFGARGEDPEKPGVTSPGTVSPTIVERLENEDEEIESLKNTGRVNNLISQFKQDYDSATSVHTDSGVSTQSGDELSVSALGEVAVTRRSNLNRSSSLKTTGEQRHRSRAGERRSKSDVDMDQQAIMASHSYMGSASSLSGKSQESLSSMPETRTYTDDSDMEAEQDTPNWSKAVDKDIVKKLKPKEVRRQEIINELFHTERTHVRNLKVLDKVFYQPLLNDQVLPKETVMYLFPNLPALLDEHGILNSWMKKEKKTSHVVQGVGNLLIQRFDGDSGETMKMVSAEFCSNQRHALELLKAKQRKDPKLAAFIQEAECHPLCRRLPLRGIISTQMQRLTKYPLFIQNLLKYSQPKTPDHAKLERALYCCKELLDHVNQAVREADNRHRLSELKQKTDTTAYDRITKANPDEVSVGQIFHKLLYDSPVTWKLSRNKTLEMHAMLMEDFVVLLQKQDEKYVLKFHSTSSVVPLQTEVSVNNKRNTHSPIIRLSTTLCRQVATSKKAFFLISTSTQGPQIYELVAPSNTECKTWMDLITGAQDNIKRRGSGKGTMPVPLPQRHYPINEGDEERNENMANLTAERAESTSVVVEKPEVVPHIAPFPNVTVEEQGDATTLLKKALDEPIDEGADSRKASQHIRLLLSRVIRVGKEKGMDQLVMDALDKCHTEVQRFQTLHNKELKLLEEEIDSELNTKNEMKEEIQRLRQEVSMTQHIINGGVQDTPTANSEESIVTDLDHADTDPDTTVEKNRHSYSAESNSSATDDSDGIDHHDYEEVTDGPDPVDDYSGDSSENTPQPHVHKVQPQVAAKVVNTQLYNLQGGNGESVEKFVAATAEEVQASCIQEESAYSEEELATKMNSMNLATENAADSTADEIKPSPGEFFWALPEAESGKAFTPVEGRTSVDNYEKVGLIVAEEYSVPPETIAASGDLSSASESVSSLADDTSSSCVVDFASSGQPEGGADESLEIKSSKHDESGSTSASSSSGSSRPASMISADSGSEDVKGDQSSNPDGKDSEDSDDQTIQVMPTENLLELVADGDDDGAPTGSQEGNSDMTEEPPQSIPADEGGTDVDNPTRLPSDLIIDESLPESSTNKTDEIQSRDINLNQNNVTEEVEDASSQETSETEVLKVVEEHDSKGDEETKERREHPPLPAIPVPSIPSYQPDILSFDDSDSDDYEEIV